MAAISPPLFRLCRNLDNRICLRCLARRNLSHAATLRSGHSRWSTIKHDKARVDLVRNKQNAAFSREIAAASKFYGPDPQDNPRLAAAMAAARKAGVSKAFIAANIARGQGQSATGAPLESVVIEATAPPGIGLIIDTLTDSKNRTIMDLRRILKERGAMAAPTAYLFEKRGRVTFAAKEGIGVDEVLEAALDAGAVDVWEDEEGNVVVDTESSSLKEVEARLATDVGLEVSESEMIWFALEETRVGSAEVEMELLLQLEQLRHEILDYPGVQAVYINLDLEAALSEAGKMKPGTAAAAGG